MQNQQILPQSLSRQSAIEKMRPAPKKQFPRNDFALRSICWIWGQMWRSWHCHCQLPLVVNCKLYRSWRHSSHCFETISCTNIRGVLCFSWTQGHSEHIEFNTWIISSLFFITCYITTICDALIFFASNFLGDIFPLSRHHKWKAWMVTWRLKWLSKSVSD